MKIVIDIPEEVYSYIDSECKELGDGHDSIINHLIHGVLHGTVLPKGHGRLIEETDRLKMEMRSFERYTGIEEAPYEYASELLNKVPTIIEADKGEAENVSK